MQRPLVIGVAGGSGAGKTTVTREILDRVGRERIALLPHDSYYKDLSNLPFAERRQINFDHPDAFDNTLYAAHLDALLCGCTIPMPIYDYATYTRATAVTPVVPRPVVLLEGILLFVDARLRERMDIRLFVDAESDLRVIRRIQRDLIERGRTVDSVIDQYLQSVRPMHLEFVEPSKRYADVIIPNDAHNQIAIDVVVALVERMLASADAAR